MRKAQVAEISKESTDDNVVCFSGDFSVVKGEEIRQKLCFAMIDCPRLVIDLSDVSRIDLAGFQLICATHRKAQESGTDLRIQSPLPVHVAEAASGAGFPRSISCTHIFGRKDSCIWSFQNNGEQSQVQK